MIHPKTPETSLVYFRWSIGAALLIWTLLVGGSTLWSARQDRAQTMALAKKEAMANFNKDQAFRQWGSKHGGVYVPPTKDTPPNPYLAHIPERDLTLPSGKQLTLMNPAYMVRQMMDDFGALYGIKGRITSLQPLNPINAPDGWEITALTAFAQGAKEVMSVEDSSDGPQLRLMRPMVTQAGCLKCHAQQGYKIGDIRGGVGVNVPLAPYLLLEKKLLRTTLLSYLLIWLLGATGLGFVYVKGSGLLAEQARSREALQASNEFLDSVVENIPNMIFVKDAKELRFVKFNKAGEELLGYRREDLYGKNDYDFFPPSEAEFSTSKDREVLNSQRLLDIPDETIETHDKGRRFLHTKKIPLMNAQGEPEFLLGISEDITEQKRAAAEWGAAMDASEDVIYLLDLERRVVRANKAFYAMTSSTPEIALGRHIVELVHPGGEKIPCPVCLAQVEKRDSHLILESDHPHNPAGRPLEITLRIVRDEQGTLVSMLMTLHDLSRERAVQEELNKYREQLEELVKTRTAEIVEKNAELERMNKLFVGRELRMVELKERIRALENEKSGEST